MQFVQSLKMTVRKMKIIDKEIVSSLRVLDYFEHDKIAVFILRERIQKLIQLKGER